MSCNAPEPQILFRILLYGKDWPQEPLLISTIESTDRYRKDGFCKPHLQNALGSQEFYGCLGGAFILSPPRHF